MGQIPPSPPRSQSPRPTPTARTARQPSPGQSTTFSTANQPPARRPTSRQPRLALLLIVRLVARARVILARSGHLPRPRESGPYGRRRSPAGSRTNGLVLRRAGLGQITRPTLPSCAGDSACEGHPIPMSERKVMSTTPPRNVIYYNDAANLIPLAGIASLAYTDVILGFLLPNGKTGLTGQAYNSDPGSSNSTFDSNGNPYPEDIITLQNAGKNVLISLGGQTFTTDDWQQYAKDVSGLVQQVAEYVTSNNLNGVDIDYEDDHGFTGGPDGKGVYDGIRFLIDLTNGLAQALPPGQNIITHAPAPGYFYSSDIYNNAYTEIMAQAGNNISWFNCQFYNNSGYDEPASTKVSSYSTIAETTSPSKLLVGTPVGAGAAGSGYLPLDQFIGDVIGPLRQQYPAAFGGVMGWEFSYDQGGTWADGIGLALQQQQQHVFYVGRDGNVHHVYWDPTAGINADQWTTDAQVGSNLATLLDGAQQHVFYVAADGNVHHVYWDPTAGINADQWTSNAQAGAKLATVLLGDQQHVFYVGRDGNVHHVYWDPTAGINADQWTTNAQAVSNLATLLDGAQQHVFYVAADGNVHHVYWDPTAGINADQWTSDGQAGAELAAVLTG